MVRSAISGNLENLYKFQKSLIININDYIKNLKNRGILPSESIFGYFASWDLTPGILNILYRINKNNLFKLIKYYLKYFIGIGYQSNYLLYNDLSNKNYKNLFVTWGYKSSFDSNGDFYDHYFKLNSNYNKNNVWLIIYMDNELPKKISKNIVLIYNKNRNFNFLYFLKIIIFNLISFKFNMYLFFHYTSSSNNFGNIVLKKLQMINKIKDLKKIYMPYESQIFQNKIISFFKKKNKKIKVYGYVHDFEPITPNLIYKENSPDFLLLPGDNRKKFFINNLKWTSNRIIKVKSFRYNYKDIGNFFFNKILLPSGIYNIDLIKLNLVDFFKKKPNFINNLKVRKHPNSTNKKLQLFLENEIKTIIYNSKLITNLKKKNKKKITLVIGISSLVILALQKQATVYHLTMDPELQVYNSKFWPEIKVEQITNNIFKYSLRSKKTIFNFTSQKNHNSYFQR